MKLGIVFITHERLAYTKKSLESLLETVDAYDSVVVVDNNSSDGTLEWLNELHDSGKFQTLKGIVGLPDNFYPGYSANRGWEVLLDLDPSITHLMRSDNDMLYLEGWRLRAREAFMAFSTLGQLGLMSQVQAFVDDPEAQKLPHKMPVAEMRNMGVTVNTWWTNIGGTCIIRRDLWDMGLRYKEDRWHSIAEDVATPQEDVKLSLEVKSMGYFFANMMEDLVREMSYGETDDFYDYYCRTFTERGHGIPPRTKNGKTIDDSGNFIKGHGGSNDHI